MKLVDGKRLTHPNKTEFLSVRTAEHNRTEVLLNRTSSETENIPVRTINQVILSGPCGFMIVLMDYKSEYKSEQLLGSNVGNRLRDVHLLSRPFKQHRLWNFYSGKTFFSGC